MKKVIVTLLEVLISIGLMAQNNIGINILNPEYTLDIRSVDISTRSVVNISNSNNSHFLRLSSGESKNVDPNIYWSGNSALRFIQANAPDAEVARIDEDGNMGIGVIMPVEKLDLDGNMKISGEIKPSGQSGQKGQLLVADGSGTMTWSDPCQYNHFKGYYTDATWMVPDGVTEVKVEIWGAGGGGHSGGGGGGGGYLCGIIPVTPGEILEVEIGLGGNGGTSISAAGDGDITYIRKGTANYFSFGGEGATTTNPGLGGNSGASNYSLWNQFISFNGYDGESKVVSYAQKNISTFVRIIKFGKGGDGSHTTNTGGAGGLITENESSGVNYDSALGIYGNIPGGGGGSYENSGYSGARGYAIIWWK
jgi:hypothetical protein